MQHDRPVGRIGILVVAGGAGRRAGGVDKALLALDGRPLLAHVLDSVRAAEQARPSDEVEAVVVGPRRDGFAGVRWAQESPPGGGPLAAVAAGEAVLTADVSTVLVLGGDMPYVSRAVPALLAALDEGPAAAVLVAGQPQPLASAWRRAALATALDELAPPEGVPLRRLLDRVDAAAVPDLDGASADVDALADLDGPEAVQ